MRKHRKSTAKLLLATIVLTVGMGLTSYAEDNPEVKAAVQRATDAGAGSYQGSYINGGWKEAHDIDLQTRAVMDENGMIVSPTSGIVGKYVGVYDYPSAGADRSIKLATDPAHGDLQPNWLYNPLGKTVNVPPVICMDKNTYNTIGWTQVSQDLNTGIFSYRMDTCDTSGSWVYNPNPTGSTDYSGRAGQLAGWMYRYADGTYAANGVAYIYSNQVNNGTDTYIVGQAYYFNENGFLVTNTPHDATYLDEYGQVCDGTIGPFGTLWYYTR